MRSSSDCSSVRERQQPQQQQHHQAAQDDSAEGQMRQAIANQIIQRLNELSKTSIAEVNSLTQAQSRLNESATQLKGGLAEWKSDKVRIDRELEEIERRTQDLEQWLADNEEKAEEMDLTVDELLIPQDSWSEQ